jgi:protein TonB
MHGPQTESIGMMKQAPSARHRLRWTLAGCSTALTTLLAGCSSAPPSTPSTAVAPTTPVASAKPSAPAPAAALATPPKISTASTPRDYRRDAARHLYERNAGRIYQGKLQPNLYAVGVLEVHVDRQGGVTGLHWMRAPKHAPEVIAEIERTVHAAAPFPPPSRLGHVTYTDTWLWDKSGQFQLDTLTEGQL